MTHQPMIHRRRTPWRSLLALLLVHLVAVSEEEPPPLTASLQVDGVQPRSGAPWWARVTLTSAAPAILEGHLVLSVDFFGDGNAVERFRTGELVLRPGEQSFRMLLPDLGTGGVLSLSFEAGDAVHRLGSQPLAWLAGQDTVTICSAEPVAAAAVTTALLNGLRVERVVEQRRRRSGMPTVTMFARVDPSRLPDRPIGFCAFDLVLLTGPGFLGLSAGQLDALEAWVLAGGSIVVATGGGQRSGFGERHVRFLNRLADSDDPVVERDRAGRLSWASEPGPTRMRLAEPGVGRAALSIDDTLPDPDAPWFRDAVRFLWNTRPRVGPTTIVGGPGVPLQPFVEQSLQPEGVSLLPWWLVAILLLGFLAATSPLDYLILGRLRRRSLTWLIFPALTVGFTFLVVELSDEFLTSRLDRRRLVLQDGLPDGTVVRRSEFDLFYAAFDRVHEETGSDVIVSALERQEYSLYAPDPVPSILRDAKYEGHLASRSTFRLPLKKWRPQLVRRLELGPGAPLPPEVETAFEQIDWNRGTAASFPGTLWESDGESVRLVRSSGSPDAFGVLERIVFHLCREIRGGPFTRRAPRGGILLGDLVLDRSDRALVALFRSGGDIYMRRCVYRGGAR